MLDRLANRGNDRLLRALAGAMFAFVYAEILFPVARFYWFIPAGWRFAALAVLPLRYWPWILGGEAWARFFVASMPWHQGDSITEMLALLGNLGVCSMLIVAPLASIPGSWMLRRRYRSSDLPQAFDTLGGMGWLLICCLVSAIGETLGNFMHMRIDGAALPPGLSLLRFSLGKLTGDYMGVIALVPALFVLAPQRRRELARWRDWVLALIVFAAAYLIVMRSSMDPAVYDYARILLLAPAFVAATRYGWPLAALTLSACSVLVAMAQPLHHIDPYRDLFTQMLLALFGSAALLLGASTDSQRAAHAALTARNADLDRLARELRDAAQRNLSIEETQRRRLAIEIHDELGQNLTAVHARLKLAEDRIDAAALGDVSRSIIDILGTMRRSVHGLMDSLRPPALDEFGLVRALESGPLRELVERAGLRYSCRIHDRLALVGTLGEEMQIALWRLAQEATANAVRHARATRIGLRLRTGLRGDAVWAFLDVRDDGVGIAATRDPAHRGEGLQGMRDRVLAFDGCLLLEPARDGGTRVHALLRQAT